MLAAWELGRRDSRPLERALALLGAAYPDTSGSSLAALTIGQRDALLLALRELAFGPELGALAECPGCALEVAFEMRIEDLLVDRASADEPLCLHADGYEVEFRLPNSADLRELKNVSDARQALAQRLISRSVRSGVSVKTQELPEKLLAELEQKMEEADPQSDIELNLHCEACGHCWQVPFDIVQFLWTEVDAWAVRMFREVHCLARVYGWSEADILAMSPWRRQCYLELITE